MTLAELSAHLLSRIREVLRALGDEADVPDDAGLSFADLLDSMAMVEFLVVVGDDCGVPPERIEQCVARRFGTVGELAAALQAAGLAPDATAPRADESPDRQSPDFTERRSPKIVPARQEGAAREDWLIAAAAQLPDSVQPAAYVNEQIGRASGWLEGHAGIFQRRVWAEQDPLAAAARAGRVCLERIGMSASDVGMLLTTSEAPPLLAGLSAALHHRLGLPPDAVALEIGGACTGFLSTLWLARNLHSVRPATLLIAVEAPSRYLALKPGSAGEAAALFGDGAAACLIARKPLGNEAVLVNDVTLAGDGSAADLIHVAPSTGAAVEVRLRGQALSIRAMKAMGRSVRALAEKHHLQLTDLAGIVMHGGNGRFPALLARQLGLPAERIHSQTAQTGNLGAASLPVAWAALPSLPRGPVIWTAVGAGLTWGAALLGTKH
jgi:3-oxoacyl-[acyl-carrier-protein] synthase-3